MATKSVALAIASGFATFLVVGIMVSEIAGHWGVGGFAILLGLFVGSIAGAVATAATTAGLTSDVPERQRRLTGAFAGFVVGFVVGFALGMRVLAFDARSSFATGVAVGLLAAVWGSSQGEPLSVESQS